MDVGNLYKELAVNLLICFNSFNEKERIAERYARFNVPELMRIAAMAVGRDRCMDIMKVTKGGFNKIFLHTMDDGYEVIAQIPTPIAGPAYYTTASEVATIDFLLDWTYQYQKYLRGPPGLVAIILSVQSTS